MKSYKSWLREGKNIFREVSENKKATTKKWQPILFLQL